MSDGALVKERESEFGSNLVCDVLHENDNVYSSSPFDVCNDSMGSPRVVCFFLKYVTGGRFLRFFTPGKPRHNSTDCALTHAPNASFLFCKIHRDVSEPRL